MKKTFFAQSFFFLLFLQFFYAAHSYSQPHIFGPPAGSGQGSQGFPPNSPHPRMEEPQEGPWVHEIWSASSPDGLTWKEDGTLHFKHASVPAALVLKDGSIALYFVDAEIRPSSVNMALSTDGGKSFSKKDFVITGLPEKTTTVDPCPVLLNDGRVRLYFFSSRFGFEQSGGGNKSTSQMPHQPPGSAPKNGPPGPQGNPNDPANLPGKHSIASAISSDGIHFTYEGEVFSYDGLVDPDVFYTGSKWLMYVMSLGHGTVIAESQDGVHFSYLGTMKPERMGTTAAIRLSDGTFRVYAFKQGEQTSFISLTSKDGISWLPESGTRLVAPTGKEITDPFVIQLGENNWKMYYKVGPGKKIPH